MVMQDEKVESTLPQPAPRLLKGRLLRGCKPSLSNDGLLAARRPRPPWPTCAPPMPVTSSPCDSPSASAGSNPCLATAACPNGRDRCWCTRPACLCPKALLEAILAVERCVACAMCRLDSPRFSKVVRHDGEIELVWEAHSAGVSRAAARAAFAGLMELLPTELRGELESGRDFETLIAKLQRRSRRRQWSKSTAVLALGARQRGIPHELLAGNYVRLGEGTMQYIVSESALEAALRPRNEAGLIEFPPGTPGGLRQATRSSPVGGRWAPGLCAAHGSTPAQRGRHEEHRAVDRATQPRSASKRGRPREHSNRRARSLGPRAEEARTAGRPCAGASPRTAGRADLRAWCRSFRRDGERSPERSASRAPCGGGTGSGHRQCGVFDRGHHSVPAGRNVER